MEDYVPPAASLPLLGNVASLLRDAKTKAIASGPYVTAKKILRLPGGQIYSESGLQADADGSPEYNKQDATGQPGTALEWPGHRSLDSARVPYVAFSTHFARQAGFRKGDLAVVIYKNRLCYAIYGDVSGHALRNGSTDRSHYSFGEASIRVHEQLGHPVVYKTGKGGTPRFHNVGIGSGVLIVVFPGSGTGQAMTEAAIVAHARPLWDALRGASAGEKNT